MSTALKRQRTEPAKTVQLGGKGPTFEGSDSQTLNQMKSYCVKLIFIESLIYQEHTQIKS